MENKNILYGALAALGIGGAIYMLMQDDGEQVISYTKKVHTLEKLLPCAEEMDLDFRCFYVRVYNLILKMKDNNEFQKRMLQDLQSQLSIELNDKAQQNIKNYNLGIFKEMMRNQGMSSEKQKELTSSYNKALASKDTNTLMQVFADLSGVKDDKKLYKEWFAQTLSLEVYKEFLAANRKEPKLQTIKEGIEKLHNQVFIDILVLPNPEFAKQLEQVKLDRESYIRIQRKIWATLRHDLYLSIQAWKKKNPSQLNCPPAVVQELWETEFSNFETVRQEIFKLITGHDVDIRKAKSLMLKAYLEFSAVSDTMKFDSAGKPIGTPMRSRWPDLVQETAKKHNEYILEISKGKFYDNIEKDPRTHAGADEKIDLGFSQEAPGNNADSAYNRQKSKIIEQMAAKTQVTPAANKIVNKLLQKARDVKEKQSKDREAEAAATAAATPVDTKQSLEPVKVESQVSDGIKMGESIPMPQEENNVVEKIEAKEEAKVVEVVEEVKTADVPKAPESEAPAKVEAVVSEKVEDVAPVKVEAVVSEKVEAVAEKTE